jgi:hypothetical protein
LENPCVDGRVISNAVLQKKYWWTGLNASGQSSTCAGQTEAIVSVGQSRTCVDLPKAIVSLCQSSTRVDPLQATFSVGQSSTRVDKPEAIVSVGQSSTREDPPKAIVSVGQSSTRVDPPKATFSVVQSSTRVDPPKATFRVVQSSTRVDPPQAAVSAECSTNRGVWSTLQRGCALQYVIQACTGLLFYHSVIDCHFLSARLSHYRRQLNCLPTDTADSRLDVTKNVCQIK